MITTNDILTRLRNGESMDAIGQSIADVLNEAQGAYDAELEAAKQAQAANTLAIRKRELAEDFIHLVQDYGDLVCPGSRDILSEYTDEDLDEMIAAIDQMFNLLQFAIQMRAALEEKPQAKSHITPATKAPKSDDEVLANFIKSLLSHPHSITLAEYVGLSQRERINSFFYLCCIRFPRVGFDTCCPFNLCYDTLTNKPNSVSDELESSGWIELACCHFKTLVACFDKFFQ